jgi:regulation of enolase protein 1 (concanavalin A-like superfamily)
VVAAAPAHTNLYLNPGGADAADAGSMINAATLLGTPPSGDFQFSARISVDFRARYDAGVLLLWVDDVSDDANAFVVPGRSVWLRVSRVDRVYSFHASTDATTWRLVRVFSLGDAVADHQIGLEAQSPTGDGCTVTFDQIGFIQQRLQDLRDGS